MSSLSRALLLRTLAAPALCAWVVACNPGHSTGAQTTATATENPMTTTGKDPDDMASKLISGAYGEFFNYAVHDATIAAVWGEPDSLARLEAIVQDEGAPMMARFLACEVLFKKHFIFVRDVGAETVAGIYSHALTNDLTGRANSWGLLYEHNDDGPVGLRFVTLGEAAIPTLLALLHDGRRALTYAGSETATVGNAYEFRIKDYAAFYISKIRRIPMQFHQDFTQRDAEIDRLVEAVRRGRGDDE